MGVIPARWLDDKHQSGHKVGPLWVETGRLFNKYPVVVTLYRRRFSWGYTSGKGAWIKSKGRA